MEHVRSYPRGHLVAILASLAVVVGAFGPWATAVVSGPGGEIRQSTAGIDAVEVILLVVVPAILALVAMVASPDRDPWLFDSVIEDRTYLGAGLLGLAGLYALVKVADLSTGGSARFGGTTFGARPGWGLIVSVVGAIVGVAGALVGGLHETPPDAGAAAGTGPEAE